MLRARMFVCARVCLSLRTHLLPLIPCLTTPTHHCDVHALAGTKDAHVERVSDVAGLVKNHKDHPELAHEADRGIVCNLHAVNLQNDVLGLKHAVSRALVAVYRLCQK